MTSRIMRVIEASESFRKHYLGGRIPGRFDAEINVFKLWVDVSRSMEREGHDPVEALVTVLAALADRHQDVMDSRVRESQRTLAPRLLIPLVEGQPFWLAPDGIHTQQAPRLDDESIRMRDILDAWSQSWVHGRVPQPSISFSPSDTGREDAVPLPPVEARNLELLSHGDEVWAEQNRRINALIAGREEP